MDNAPNPDIMTSAELDRFYNSIAKRKSKTAVALCIYVRLLRNAHRFEGQGLHDLGKKYRKAADDMYQTLPGKVRWK